MVNCPLCIPFSLHRRYPAWTTSFPQVSGHRFVFSGFGVCGYVNSVTYVLF